MWSSDLGNHYCVIHYEELLTCSLQV